MRSNQYTRKKVYITRKVNKALHAYPKVWKKIVSEWSHAHYGDHMWLTYSANYLLRTAGIRWALDPFSLTTRVHYHSHPIFLRDLYSIQLIVLSHFHNDHLDPNLLLALSDLPITWVIPEFMLDSVQSIVKLNPSRLILPYPGIPITHGNLVLTPFNALHFNLKCHHGVPEMGYLAEFNGKRWLFPGDTRNYDPVALPNFGKVDGVLAHCWLGRASALDPEEEKIQDFCRFFSELKASRVIVTHLRDFGRGPQNFWDLEHYRMIKKQCALLSPAMNLSYALMGDKINI